MDATALMQKDAKEGGALDEFGKHAETVKDRSEFVSNWLKELEKARKREKSFRDKGQKLVKIFEAAEGEKIPYNILYSNTETMLPALYNAMPRPTVSGRFQRKNDALQRLAATVSERILKYLMDTNAMGYETFDSAMRQCTLEALVPGRGFLRVKYDAIFKPTPKAEGDEGALEDNEELDDKAEPKAPEEVVDYESVCLETVPWDRLLHGYGRKWCDVPWISIEHQMSRTDLEAQFPETGHMVKVEDFSKGGADQPASESLFGSRTKESKGANLATVYEIWDKVSKKVIFISPGLPRGVLKEVDDPLELSGFFPGPEPMTMVPKLSGLCPVALYKLYEQQAEELNDITVRITKLTRALRLRGFFDSTISEMGKVLEANDNTLIPVSNAAQLQSQGIGMDKALWLVPLDPVVGALQQLYSQRVQVKSVIFEITGIADIMRGSSQASETLGAQEIKNQWGTLRLKKAQKETARFARDTLRLLLELAVTKLDAETIRSMTGLPFPTEEEKRQAKGEVQRAQMQASVYGSAPQIDPQTLAVAQSPSWDDILGLLRDDSLRQFSVDIETNSTVDAEATDDKKDMAELMNALAQFLNGVTPLVQEGTLPFEAAKSILQNLLRRFRMGGEVEDALMTMQPPQNQGIDPKAQEEFQKAQEKLKQDEAAFTEQLQAEKLKLAQAQADLDMQAKQLAMQHEFNQKELAMQQQFNQQILDLQKREAEQSVAFKVEAGKQKLSADAAKSAASLNAKRQQQKGGE